MKSRSAEGRARDQFFFFFFNNEDKLLYDKKKKEKWCNMESIGQHGPPVGFEEAKKSLWFTILVFRINFYFKFITESYLDLLPILIQKPNWVRVLES